MVVDPGQLPLHHTIQQFHPPPKLRQVGLEVLHLLQQVSHAPVAELLIESGQKSSRNIVESLEIVDWKAESPEYFVEFSLPLHLFQFLGEEGTVEVSGVFALLIHVEEAAREDIGVASINLFIIDNYLPFGQVYAFSINAVLKKSC